LVIDQIIHFNLNFKFVFKLLELKEDWLRLIMAQDFIDVSECEQLLHFNFILKGHLQYSDHLILLYSMLVLHSSEILVILYFFEVVKDSIFQLENLELPLLHFIL
jgi:hypothetical protein